jgi:hypothetical protein
MFKGFPIDIASVKAGQNSREVVTACRCVNVGLFVSGDLRRDVIVSIVIGTEEDLRVVSFPGDSLKRVSPDERSISFFLLKAFEKAQDLETGGSFKMNNGIELIHGSLGVQRPFTYHQSIQNVLSLIPIFQLIGWKTHHEESFIKSAFQFKNGISHRV